MAKIELKDLSEKQRRAWRMRYRYGWKLKKIAAEMGVRTHTISELLQRAQSAGGIATRAVRARHAHQAAADRGRVVVGCA